MKKVILSIVSLLILNLFVFSQNEIVIDKVVVINYGDGHLLFRDSETEKPLEGQHRIIDGYHSAFILAGFSEGFYDGNYKEYVNNNLSSEGYYTKGIPDGLFTDYYGDGKTIKAERPISNGKVDGIVKTYNPDGTIEAEKGYKDGKEHGPDKLYYEGQLIRDCNYIDGKLHGEQIEYIRSNRDNYTKISNFDNGLAAGEYSETLDNGVIRLEGKFVNGKKDGKWITRRKEGIPEKEENYKEGQLDGPFTIYYMDGTVEKEMNYKAGKLDGVNKTYYWDTGKEKTFYTYKEGKKRGNINSFMIMVTCGKTESVKMTGKYLGENSDKTGH